MPTRHREGAFEDGKNNPAKEIGVNAPAKPAAILRMPVICTCGPRLCSGGADRKSAAAILPSASPPFLSQFLNTSSASAGSARPAVPTQTGEMLL
jgi:hypothetical protein